MLVRQASTTPLAPRAIRVRKSYLVWYQKPATMPRTWKGSSRPMASSACAEAGQQVVAQADEAGGVVHLPASAVMRGAVRLPPCSKASRTACFLGDQTGVGFDGRLEVLAAWSARARSRSSWRRARTSRSSGFRPWALNSAALACHLGLGHAAHQMRAHVVRLGRRRVVGVAADVEVVVVVACSVALSTMAEKPSMARNSSKVVTIFSMCSGSRWFCARPSKYSRSALMNSTLPWRSAGLPLTRLAPFWTRWRSTRTQAGMPVP